MKIASLYSREHCFPIDAMRRRLSFLWWEPAVLLLPWRPRVAFWNWLFDSDVDYLKTSDPFMVQWLQLYWPFCMRHIPDWLHRAVWNYCFPEAKQ